MPIGSPAHIHHAVTESPSVRQYTPASTEQRTEQRKPSSMAGHTCMWQLRQCGCSCQSFSEIAALSCILSSWVAFAVVTYEILRAFGNHGED